MKNDIMQAGTYYIGDLCYVIRGPLWQELCNKMFLDNNIDESGKYTLSNGLEVAIFGTMYGDGVYHDTEGRNYFVDSGTIGCVKSNDVNTDDLNSGYGVNTFESDFECWSEGGYIHIGNVIIDTAQEDNNDSDYYYQFGPYEDED